jgi:hypothetical protein
MAGNQTSSTRTLIATCLPALPAVGEIFLQINEAANEGLQVDLSGTEGFVLDVITSSYLPTLI